MLMLLSASGRGKRISLSAFKQQTRAGRGKRGMGLLKGDAVAAYVRPPDSTARAAKTSSSGRKTA